MTTPRNARLARTTAALLTALLLIGFALAVRNADMIYLPDGHHLVERSLASGGASVLVRVADLGPAGNEAAARAYAESLGLAVD